ncbi:hypothetical protein ACIQU2_27415 [Pseudomonas sp. NPDC098740]|uniref:hypothetical protein n=1 Tax=Pseudomonas sp. NPDC098740 TaxID=3364486 RepID=UPI00383A7E41
MPHVFHPSQPIPEWVAQADPVTNLIAFWVGDMDIYAALSPEHALALCVEHSAMPDAYDLDDVLAVCAKTLDLPMVEEDGTPAGTLRELLAATTEPGWLAGFE